MISANDEDQFVEWIISEIINEKLDGKPDFRLKAKEWATQTKFQKMIFTIVSELNLPVTHCWYLWGGIVQSSELEKDQFNNLLTKYHERPSLYAQNRQDAIRYGVKIDEVIEIIQRELPHYEWKAQYDYLQYFYERYCPKHWKDVYLSKHYLINHLNVQRPFTSENEITDYVNDINRSLSVFQINSLGLIEDVDDSNILFTDALSNLLAVLKDDYELYKTHASFIANLLIKSSLYLTDPMWYTYASDFAIQSMNGNKKEEGVNRYKNIKMKYIAKTSTSIDDIINMLNNSDIMKSLIYRSHIRPTEKTKKFISYSLNSIDNSGT